jgi:hypothetical protein
MKICLPLRILLGVLVCLTGLWTSPAAGRLYPPVQGISYSVENSGTRIRYWLTDISFFSNTEETWDVPQADVVRQIILPAKPVDQGILTWIAQYRNTGDSSLTYWVHYRIYDPGRGHWRAGSWGPLGPGSGTWVDQHQVKDGVVAWVAHQMVNNSYTMEHSVHYATYDPYFGSFAQSQLAWQVPYSSKYAPEVLRVQNGVVAWPMRDIKSGQASDEKALDIFYAIYDQELHQWQFIQYCWSNPTAGFDWIKVLNDTVVVDLQYSNWYLGNLHDYMFYNPTTHKWDLLFNSDYETAYGYAVKRRAFFVAAPNLGFVPFTTCFWDCSFALDGFNTPSTWRWDMEGSDFSTDRSPVLNLPFLITFPGPFDRMDTVTAHVTYNDSGTPYTATAQVRETRPAPPPTGNISINNGTADTNSSNITLILNYDPSATQMRFRQTPGDVETDWEPVAATKTWALRNGGAAIDGPYIIDVVFRNQDGTPSPMYSAAITLVTKPPAAVLWLDWGATATTNRNVQVFACAVTGYQGCPLQMSYAACEINKSDIAWGVWWTPWAYYPDLLPLYAVVPFSSPSGQKPVMVGLVQFKDDAGNITQVQASIALKPPPLSHLLLLLGD